MPETHIIVLDILNTIGIHEFINLLEKHCTTRKVGEKIKNSCLPQKEPFLAGLQPHVKQNN